MYPRVLIDLGKYRENVKYLSELCKEQGLTIMAVTKVFCGDQNLVDILNTEDIDYIADSRLDNLENTNTSLPKVLLRIPSIYEAEKVVKTTDISLNSELKTIEALNTSAQSLAKTHSVIIMIDIGDLREGLFYKDNILEVMKSVQELSNINLIGIGTNLTCYGGIIPSRETLEKLFKIIDYLQRELKISFDIVSGGNSSHIHLLLQNIKLPKISNLRLGEALILGRETAYGNKIANMHQDVIVLEADLIEIKTKPSIPEGDIGMDAFGKIPTFEDVGLMKRGILALGKQDIDFHELIPHDPAIRLIGSSSDHIIVDLTHSKTKYEVGNILRFSLTYGSVLSLMTSKYVRKEYV